MNGIKNDVRVSVGGINEHLYNIFSKKNDKLLFEYGICWMTVVVIDYLKNMVICIQFNKHGYHTMTHSRDVPVICYCSENNTHQAIRKMPSKSCRIKCAISTSIAIYLRYAITFAMGKRCSVKQWLQSNLLNSEMNLETVLLQLCIPNADFVWDTFYTSFSFFFLFEETPIELEYLSSIQF